jgi:hypothetical protein
MSRTAKVKGKGKDKQGQGKDKGESHGENGVLPVAGADWDTAKTAQSLCF